MKKIIKIFLFIVISIFGISNISAYNIGLYDGGVSYNGDLISVDVTATNIQIYRNGILDYTLPNTLYGDDFYNSDFLFFSDVDSGSNSTKYTYFVGVGSNYVFYNENGNWLRWASSDKNIYLTTGVPPYSGNYCINTGGGGRSFYNPQSSMYSSSQGCYGGDTGLDFTGNIVFENTILSPALSCETKTIKKNLFVNYAPVNQADILESGVQIEGSIKHNFLKTLSGSTISIYNIKNLQNYTGGLVNDGIDVTFKSDNAFIGDNPSIFLSNYNGFDYIDIDSSNIYTVDILKYNKLGNYIGTDSSVELLGGILLNEEVGAVILEFNKSLYTRNINKIIFGKEQLIDVDSEVCVDSNNNYTIDGNAYTGPLDGLDSNGVIPLDQWTFTQGGYTFLTNGFILNNFIPYPYGGELSFEIITPLGEKMETRKFLDYSVDGGGYGFDSAVKVTTFFHETSGEYKVRIKYTYAGVSTYPYGLYYNSYNITSIEVRGADAENILAWNVQSCNDGADTGILYGVSNFFICGADVLKNMLSGIGKFINGIQELIKKLSNMYTTEVATFSFIPNANALSNSDYISNIMPDRDNGYNGSFLSKIELFFRGTVVVFLGLVGIIVFIKLNKKEG